jgi:hypothetical protein
MALMLSDCNLVFLRGIAFFPRDCPIPNDSRGNPAIVPAAIYKNMSKIDHTPITETGHTRTMDSEFQTLTREEFASLLSRTLTVGYA